MSESSDRNPPWTEWRSCPGSTRGEPAAAFNKDTVQSAHFIGLYTKDETALFLSNFSKPLTYTGTVKLIGDNSLPSTYIETAYINNRPNQLLVEGKNTVSENQLPEINPDFKKIFNGIRAEKINLADVEKPKDSLYKFGARRSL